MFIIVSLSVITYVHPSHFYVRPSHNLTTIISIIKFSKNKNFHSKQSVSKENNKLKVRFIMTNL